MDFRTLLIAGLTGALAAAVTADVPPEPPPPPKNADTILGTLSDIDGQALKFAESRIRIVLDTEELGRPREFELSLGCEDYGAERANHIWTSLLAEDAKHLKPEDEIPRYLHDIHDCRAEDVARYNRIKWMMMTGATISVDRQTDAIIVASSRGQARFKIFYSL